MLHKMGLEDDCEDDADGHPFAHIVDCWACDGAGKTIGHHMCTACNGRGYFDTRKMEDE